MAHSPVTNDKWQEIFAADHSPGGGQAHRAVIASKEDTEATLITSDVRSAPPQGTR